jgi:AraC-like DNA-binding protein
MNALNPLLIREAVLAGLMPSDALEHAEPVALLSSALQVMAQLASSHAHRPDLTVMPNSSASVLPSESDALIHSVLASLLESLGISQHQVRQLVRMTALDAEPDDVEQPVARVALSPWQERRAKELMSSQMDKGLSIARIASECSLSRSHFSRAFKKNTGLSPRDWFLQMRLEKAKGLLADSLLSISQISLDCGFADQSHFTRVFTRSVGITPFSWRRSMGRGRPHAQTVARERLCAN